MTSTAEIVSRLEDHIKNVLAEIGVEKLVITKRNVTFHCLDPATGNQPKLLGDKCYKAEKMYMGLLLEHETEHYSTVEREVALVRHISTAGEVVKNHFLELNASPNIPAKYIAVYVDSYEDSLRGYTQFNWTVQYVRIK